MLRVLVLFFLVFSGYIGAEEIRLFDKVTLKEGQTYILPQFVSWKKHALNKEDVGIALSKVEIPVSYIEDGKLDKAEIRLLTSKFGSIEILGPEYVSVLMQPSFVLSESRVVEYASECMKNSLGPEVFISYVNVNKLTDFSVDSPNPMLQCDENSTKMLGEKGVVFVDIITPKKKETAQVWFLVKMQTKVLVARSDYKSGKEISRDDFSSEFAYVDSLNQVELLNNDSQQLWLLKKNISAGQILFKSSVGELQDVVKGDTVNAKLRYKNVELIVQVKSENSGSIGDVVHVSSLTSMEVFKAKIVGKNLVEVI